MPVEVPGTYRGVIGRFRQYPAEIQGYFESLPGLIEEFEWEASLGFAFIKVEKALNVMLYCGARKLHRADAEVAYRFVDQHHMTRKEFRRLFKNVFGEAISQAVVDLLAVAEKVRDKVIHGKTASDEDHRRAIVHVLAYASEMNDLVHRLAGFRPFTADLRGFAGRGDTLDASTTAWLMRGLGFVGRAAEDAAVE